MRGARWTSGRSAPTAPAFVGSHTTLRKTAYRASRATAASSTLARPGQVGRRYGARRLAADLTARGHPVSRTVVGELLAREKFSLQANRKTREGSGHPDRDAQFAHINASVTAALAERQKTERREQQRLDEVALMAHRLRATARA